MVEISKTTCKVCSHSYIDENGFIFCDGWNISDRMPDYITDIEYSKKNQVYVICNKFEKR